MKYKLQKLCIRLSSVFAVLAVVLCVVVPARAALVDYNDYVTNVQVDGDNDIVTVRIPAEMSWVRVLDAENNYDVFYRGTGVNHSIPFEPNHMYRLEVYIFGYVYGENGLDLSYLPVGTQITSGFSFDFDGDWHVMSSPVPTIQYLYYEAGNSSYLDYDSRTLADQTSQWPSFSDVYILRSVPNAQRLSINYRWEPIEFLDSVVPYGITVQDTVLTFSISSLLRQQQLTGKTNSLLKEVENQLIKQGKTLDDIRDQNDQIINGTVPDSVEPSGSNKFDQLEDVEQDLMDDVSGGLDVFEDLYTQTEQGLLPYLTALMAMTEVLELVADIPMIKALLSVSLALGLCSFILSVANTFGSKGGHK